MKTINSFRSKLLALTLALVAGVASFAYEFEYVNDFHIDGFGYKIISVNTPDDGEGYISLIEIADCKKDVVIPKYVSYGDRGFHVTTFGMGSVVFTNNASSVVESITIPKTTSVINKNALAGCPNLKTVVVDSENPYYDSRENCNAIITTSQNPYFTPNTLIAGCKTTIIPHSVAEIGDNAFYNSALESITIPTGTTKIGRSAFNNSILLSSITLSATLTAIGDWAFDDCNNLKEVICYAPQPPTISKYTFSDISPTVYVPENTVTIYQNAPYWMTFDIQPIQPSYKSQWCDQWNILAHGYLGPQEPLYGAKTTIYQLGGDTIINHLRYQQLTRYASDDTNQTKTYVGAIRFTKNNRQVYFYYDNAEYLLYDFKAQIGDTLEVFAGIDNYRDNKTYKHVVTNKEPIQDEQCKVTLDVFVSLELEGEIIHEEKFTTTWIEGVGSPDGIVHNCTTLREGNFVTDVLCAYVDDRQMYRTPSRYYSILGCEYNEGDFIEGAFPILSGLQRTICNEYCEDSKTSLQKFEEILFEHDKPYIYCESAFLIREENNKILIYSHSLDKDLVLYDFTLEVGDSLPRLYLDESAEKDLYWIYYNIMNVVDYHKDLEGNLLPADTLIVTDVSTITLLDGKEHKKWTFNNGMEYVEGIGSFGNRQWSGDFFQLIGNMDIPVSLHGEHLVCVSKNNKLLYQMDDTEMERLGTECLCEVETSYKSKWCDTWNVLDLKYRTIKYTTKEDFETWRYYLAQDTIINNYTYTAVTRQTTKVPEGVYPFTIPEPEYVAAVRFTDDRKVYIYYDNTEYLLYDFNVQPGDELTVFAGINHYHSHHTNTIRVDEVFGTEISLSVFPDFYGDERPTCFGITKWVEGVGDLCGFITGADCGLSEYQTALLCAYKDGNTEYTTEYEEYAEYGCEYNSGENKEYILTLPGLQRTSCTKTIGEDEYGTVWGSRSYLMQEIETATIGGKQYLLFGTNNIYDEYCSLWLREENNKILVYSTAQKKDLVLYDFTLNVGDLLSRLYVDYELSSVVDYDNDEWGLASLVVTEVSTITLLDGQEHKKWTFNNGMQYVEGIGSFGTCYAHNDFYQLIANAPLYSDVHSQHLVCVSKNNKLLYQMDDTEMERLGAECLCDYDRGPRKDNAKDGQIGGRPTPTQWNQLEVVLRQMDNNHTILQAETFSYTLEDISQQVNNKTYFQLARQSTKDTATTKSVVGALHFGKDEDNRVYFLRDGVEYVLYDFTAEIGDTVEIFAGINNYPQETTYTHVVTGKDTLENGACRMILEVVFPDETTTAENAEKVWLAGLGSIDGIVHNTATRTNNAHATPARSANSETQTSVMLCAWREDSCLYMTNHPDYDAFGCVYNQDLTAVESPTSSSSYQKVLRRGQLLIMHNGKTYTVMGIEMK